MRYLVAGIAAAICWSLTTTSALATWQDPPLVAPPVSRIPKAPKWVRVKPGPETTKITEPLDDSGYVDFVEALNRLGAEGVTPDNNAVVPLIRAIGPRSLLPEIREEFFRRLGIPPLPDVGEYFYRPTDYSSPVYAARPEIKPWKPAERKEVFEWLQANEESMALLTQASLRKQFYLPLVGFAPRANGGGGDFSSTNVMDLGIVYAAFQYRALLHAGEGDLDKAIDDLLTLERLARHVARQRTGIPAQFAGMGICHWNTPYWIALLESQDLSRDQAVRIANELRELPPLPDLADVINIDERFLELQSLQHYARSPLHGIVGDSGHVRSVMELLLWLPAWLATDWNQLATQINRRNDTISMAARLPYRERMAAAKEFLDELDDLEVDLLSELDARQSDGLRTLLNFRSRTTRLLSMMWTSFFAPNPLSMFNAPDRHKTKQDLLVISAALVAYEREHDQFPATLSELSPAYLSEVPLDRFSGEAFKYRPAEDGFTLYSVGHNNRDDGGSEEKEESPRNELDTEKDIVIRIRKPGL